MSDEKTFTIKDIEAERAHVQHERELRTDLEKKLSVFKDIDPEAYKAMQTQLSELKNKAATGSEDKIAERIKEEREAEAARAQKVIDDLTAKLNGKETELKSERVTKAILQKAADAFGKDTLELLTPIFEKDGDFEDGQVVFKDAKGKLRYSEKDPRKPLSVDEYIEEMRQKYPTAAVSHAKGGSRGDAKPISSHANGVEIRSMADAARLPDKGAAFFKELAKTKDGEVRLKQIMATAN